MLPTVSYNNFFIIKTHISVRTLDKQNISRPVPQTKLVNCNTKYDCMYYMGTLSMTDNKASAPGHNSRKRSISAFPLAVLIGATSTWGDTPNTFWEALQKNWRNLVCVYATGWLIWFTGRHLESGPPWQGLFKMKHGTRQQRGVIKKIQVRTDGTIPEHDEPNGLDSSSPNIIVHVAHLTIRVQKII